MKLNRHEHCLNGLFFFFSSPCSVNNKHRWWVFPRTMFWRMLARFYYFKVENEQGLCVPLKNKTKHLKKKPTPPAPRLYLSECIRGNELVRANVSPQSRQNAEPEARTHPSTCPKCDPGWVSPLGISCSLQIERIRLNDSGVLLKSRNSMLWCVS